VLDGAVLAGGVHGLEDQEDAVAIVGVQDVLDLGELLNALFEELLAFRLVGDAGGVARGAVLEREPLAARRDLEPIDIQSGMIRGARQDGQRASGYRIRRYRSRPQIPPRTADGCWVSGACP
jgi:hypothetical protein